MYQLSCAQCLPGIRVWVFLAKQIVALAWLSKQPLMWECLAYLLQIQLSKVNTNCLGKSQINKNKTFFLIGTTSSSQRHSVSHQALILVSAWCLLSRVGMRTRLCACVVHRSLPNKARSRDLVLQRGQQVDMILTVALTSRQCTFKCKKA